MQFLHFLNKSVIFTLGKDTVAKTRIDDVDFQYNAWLKFARDDRNYQTNGKKQSLYSSIYSENEQWEWVRELSFKFGNYKVVQK